MIILRPRVDAILSWLKYVTVEPSFFLVLFTWTVLDIIQLNLYLQKACRFNAVSEPNLSVSDCDDIENGVKFVSFVGSRFVPPKIFVVLMFIAVYTSWSDNLGKKRKPFIILPCVGLFILSLCGCAHSYWWNLKPIYAAITDVICNVIFGNVITFGIFAQLYVSDVSTSENRTARFGLLYALRLLGTILGKGAGGYILNWIGFTASYVLCSILSFFSLIIAVILIPDKSIPIEKDGSKSCSIFDVGRRIAQPWKTVFKLANKRQKCSITLLIFIQGVIHFAHEGEFTIMYLYLRYRFGWDEKMYSLFQVCGSIGLIVGSLFTSLILSKMLKIHDNIIGIIAGCWDSMIALAFVICVENWQLFLVNTLDLFYGVALTVSLSCMTKFYQSRQQGHVFSVVTMCCLPVPLCHIVYNIIFQETLHTFPSAFFILTSGLYFMTAVLSCAVYFITKNSNTLTK